MRDEERYSSSRPLKEFHGNEEDYPDWETDFETWCVRRGFDRHLEMKDPRERDRIWASYTVSRLDDPNGPIGARIHRETHDVYAQKCEMYKDKDKKLWAEVQEAMNGDAKTFVQQGPKYEGKKNVQRIKEKYGKSSAAKMCVRIVKFVMMKKKQGTSIETHNTDWGKECRQLFKPPMVLPPMLQCCLYLLSLGPEYKQFQTIAALGSDEDFIVERLMRKAKDVVVGDDEATDAVALWAGKGKGGENTRLGSKNHRPCRICGDKWHSEAECFRPGGGLDHLDRQGQEDWLEARRKRRSCARDERDEREQKRRRRDDDEREKGEANLAQQLASLAEDVKTMKQAMQLP